MTLPSGGKKAFAFKGVKRSGRMTAILLDFIFRVKGKQRAVIHGPDYVVMDRETFEEMNGIRALSQEVK